MCLGVNQSCAELRVNAVISKHEKSSIITSTVDVHAMFMLFMNRNREVDPLYGKVHVLDPVGEQSGKNVLLAVLGMVTPFSTVSCCNGRMI